MFCCLVLTVPALAQFNLKKAVSGAAKAVKAVTLTDEQMTEYVKEYIDWMDKNNPVCDANSPYTQRLNKLTQGLGDADGIPLNFKVYHVTDVNAFACADGSVRVFSSLMDIMTDEELLGVIGHEIGHVAHRDSKDGFRTALLTSALKDGISSQGGKVATLTDSQCAWSPSAVASASMVGARFARPCFVRYCTVDVFMKWATLRPEHVAAFPAVGRTWLVPDA